MDGRQLERGRDDDSLGEGVIETMAPRPGYQPGLYHRVVERRDKSKHTRVWASMRIGTRGKRISPYSEGKVDAV